MFLSSGTYARSLPGLLHLLQQGRLLVEILHLHAGNGRRLLPEFFKGIFFIHLGAHPLQLVGVGLEGLEKFLHPLRVEAVGVGDGAHHQPHGPLGVGVRLHLDGGIPGGLLQALCMAAFRASTWA